MPFKISDEGAPTNFPSPDYLTLERFNRGVITLIDKQRTPRGALYKAENTLLYEDGMFGTRWGTNWFGSSLPNDGRTTAAPVETFNFCRNPGFEVDLTGWSVYPSGTATRVTTTFRSGVASCEFVSTGGTNQGIIHEVNGMAASTTFTASAWVKSAAGVSLVLQGDTFTGPTGAGGAYVASYSSGAIVGDGTWKRAQFQVTFGPTENTINLFVGSTAAATWHVDDVQFEPGNAATDAFNGSTANTVEADYTWQGTAHNSNSTRKVYTLGPQPIDGADYFDFNGAIHLVAAAGGKVYRSTDNANTWTLCSGATLTANKPVNMNQNANFLYLTTGVDNIVRYDGTLTLSTYTSLATPVAPTLAKTGLPGTVYTYYYKIAAVNQVGFSLASPAASIQSDRPREQWDATANFITLTAPAPQATQTRLDIYFSDDNINFSYLNSIVSSTAVPSVTFKDDGRSIVVPSTLAPTGNTSQGPTVEELVNVGSRMLGVRDPANRYRIWFTGTGNYSGAFSSAYDGGYLDWQPGGKYIPVQAADYRDGKGTPLATIWCDSADGQGCVLQMSFETLTIQDISITIPSAYKLPGSRGTPAPGSVVNVLNDYYFYNSQAIYNLGSRPSLLNLLSTDEASANIRPSVKQITTSAEAGIATVYFDAKIFISVARGSSTNNCVDIYDTERKAWIPNAFTIGFKKFLQYTSVGTDGTKLRKLLAYRPGDGRLSEISPSIQGDYGQPFVVDIYTGLLPISKNRFEFQFTEEGEFEMSNTQGAITVETLGIDRTRGYIPLKSVTISADSISSTVGWDTVPWDTANWDTVPTVVATTSEASTKRYFSLQRELNAIQWHITTSNIDSRFIMRTLQSWGTPTAGGHPSSWRVK